MTDDPELLIDCETCCMRDLACGDCVVGLMLRDSPLADRSAGPAPDVVGLDCVERSALAVLAGSGLLPPLRLVPGRQPRAS